MIAHILLGGHIIGSRVIVATAIVLLVFVMQSLFLFLDASFSFRSCSCIAVVEAVWLILSAKVQEGGLVADLGVPVDIAVAFVANAAIRVLHVGGGCVKQV